MDKMKNELNKAVDTGSEDLNTVEEMPCKDDDFSSVEEEPVLAVEEPAEEEPVLTTDEPAEEESVMAADEPSNAVPSKDDGKSPFITQISLLIANSKKLTTALRVYAALFPLILFLSLEWLNPASSYGLFTNLFTGTAILSILLTVLIIVIMAVFIYGLVGSVFIAYVTVTSIWLVIYLVNYFKLSITGGVFVPTDIFLTGAAFNVMEGGAINITFGLVANVLIIILLVPVLFFVRIKISVWRRLAMSAASVVVVAVFLTGGFASNRVFPALGLDRGTETDRYRDNGLVLGFYSALIDHLAPTHATFDYLTMFTHGLSQNGAGALLKPQADPIVPNVIVIMSESFMDPTELYNLTFSQYPVPNLRRLSYGNLSGNVLVPVYGGGTSNTEFEFIGGSPHLFFGTRFYVPYESPAGYFDREIMTTLPWMFRANGYRTVAVHPYYEWFFNRVELYPLLGFEESIFKEQMPGPPQGPVYFRRIFYRQDNRKDFAGRRRRSSAVFVWHIHAKPLGF